MRSEFQLKSARSTPSPSPPGIGEFQKLILKKSSCLWQFLMLRLNLNEASLLDFPRHVFLLFQKSSHAMFIMGWRRNEIGYLY